MGRIYKALAKNLQERQTQKSESPDPTPGFDNHQVVIANNLTHNEDYRYAGLGFSQPAPSRVIEFQAPATNKPNISEDDIAGLLENILKESAKTSRSDSQRHLHMAPKTAAIFAEPKHIVNLNVNNIEPHLIALTGERAAAAENYRTLAVRLLNLTSSKNQKLKTLIMTSARAGEGKTTVATNLAWVMAKQYERRVLLIDANLQNPSVCARLGVTAQGSWLELIDKKLDFADAAIRLDPNGLYILSPKNQEALAGAAPLNDIASIQAEKLLEELAGHFDFIVIDAPALLDSADAQRLVSIADGTVMVTRAGYTPHTCVTEALKYIPKECRVGVVLNEAQIN
jgi:Mrp family chromosome partitioning ATPase